jgi:Flp pilus assembly pilin Flp
VRAMDREPAGGTRLACRPLPFRSRVSRGASSIEYALMIALIAAVVCVGLGVTVRTMFENTLQCFVANLQGITGEGCVGGPPPGGDPGSIGPGITPGPAPSPSPSATDPDAVPHSVTARTPHAAPTSPGTPRRTDC